MNGQRISRHDAEDLRRLIIKREKTQKAAAKLRSAELLADFENQMASEFQFDDDAVWAEATKAAEAEVAKAQAKIAARCQELGIPARFAPSLRLHWHNRGYDNSLEKRRAELRRVAETRIEAIEQEALVKIEKGSVDALTNLTLGALETEEARKFIDSLPTVEMLMKPLRFEEIAGPADPPIAEQLVTPNALRQRRYRDRQKALRDGSQALHNGHSGQTSGGSTERSESGPEP
jgi:hypothetical protein